MWIRNTEVSNFIIGCYIALAITITAGVILIAITPAYTSPPITESCYIQKSDSFVVIDLNHHYDDDNCETEIEKMLGYGFTDKEIESECKGYCNKLWMFKP